MTEADVLQLIADFIVANGNNEITADVLRPILEEMVKQPNDYIGDLSQLSTAANDNLVEAINEVNQAIADYGVNFVTLYQGYDNPNVTPPPTYSFGDFYLEKALDNTPIQLWRYDVTGWVNTLSSPVDVISALTEYHGQFNWDSVGNPLKQFDLPENCKIINVHADGRYLNHTYDWTRGTARLNIISTIDENAFICVDGLIPTP